MSVYFDDDIKIAGDKPSLNINNKVIIQNEDIDEEKVIKGTTIGTEIAEKFIESLQEHTTLGDDGNLDMITQRKILLAFVSISGIEQNIHSNTIISIAKNAFYKYIKEYNEELYSSSCDNGAFSFYYLAFRRGDDVERSIGQTFAMMCLHDGDPVYQELGEALYCWFSSVVKDIIIKA